MALSDFLQIGRDFTCLPLSSSKWHFQLHHRYQMTAGLQPDRPVSPRTMLEADKGALGDGCIFNNSGIIIFSLNLPFISPHREEV